MTTDPHEGTGERTADLGYARVDVDRAARTGDPEVVYGEGKTPEQVVGILRTLHERHPDRAVLATRLSSEARAQVMTELSGAVVHDVARAATLGPLPTERGLVAVISAGTSDAPVAAEAALAATVHGAGVTRIEDVGVAGLHRLLEARDRFAGADCLVVVAGMEGALPSVVGGLTGVPLVAVPTIGRVRRLLRRRGSPAGHAQLLCARRHGREHRQRLRRRGLRGPSGAQRTRRCP